MTVNKVLCYIHENTVADYHCERKEKILLY